MARQQKKQTHYRVKKKAAPKKQKRHVFLRIIVLLLIAGSIFGSISLYSTYLYVDHLVANRLKNKSDSQTGVIYSAPLTIKTKSTIATKTLKQALQNRSYLEVETAPQAAGQFRLLESIFEIYTNEFTDGSGIVHPARFVTYDTISHSIFNNKGKPLSEFVLEPVSIAALASTSQRANRYIPLNKIPDSLKDAVISVEDERFYEHSGIDLLGISRALLTNIKAGAFVQGGSTLTQQLAKNTLFSSKKTLGRKFMEALAAISLEKRLTKDEILERYLNEVYLGQEGSVAIHGAGEASQTFFNKKLEKINTSEAALLAGIIKAPSYYSPRRHEKRAMERREVVLRKMLENEKISPEEFRNALKEIPTITQTFSHKPLAPHFHYALLKELEERFNIDTTTLDGVRIYTAIEPGLQQCATEAIQKNLELLEKNYPSLKRKNHPLEAAIVAIEPISGEIKAYVGGRDFSKNQYDHASLGKRQIGSTVKPFLYLTALDENLNSYRPATADMILPDQDTTFRLPNGKNWRPENFDHKYRGDVTLRYALENSLNSPAAYIGGKVGLKSFVNTLKSFQISESIPEVPAITLGAIDTTLLKLTAAYAALANDGKYVKPRFFTSVIDGSDETVTKLQDNKVADEGAVYVLTNILQGVVERGTAKTIRKKGFTRQAAGKTGTSDSSRDAWFIGYTPTLALGVWIGFDDNAKVGLSGGVAATPIWADTMKCAEPYVADANFIPPQNVVFVDVDMRTHYRADEYSNPRDVVKEVFVRGTEPPLRHQPRDDSSFWDRLFRSNR